MREQIVYFGDNRQMDRDKNPMINDSVAVNCG